MTRLPSIYANEAARARHKARLTHCLRYTNPDGTERWGCFAFTPDEAKGMARIGRERTGLPVRVVPIPKA